MRMDGADRAPGWRPGGRPRGDTPMTCLMIIIVAIVGGIWGYYKYFHNRALENAGKDIIIVTTEDPESRNTYLRRMRDPLIPAVRAAANNTTAACTEILTGKIKDPTLANDKLTPVENRLREVMGEVNSQGVPKQFTEMHRKLAQSVGFYWRAVVLVRQGLAAKESKDKLAAFKKANGELRKGKAAFTYAEQNLKAILGR